jgi:hypothetical protein
LPSAEAVGDFTARIFTSSVSYATSPFLAFSNFIQFAKCHDPPID